MSIIAILSALSLSAMYRSRDQVFIQHAAERLKSDIRTQFINAISIKGIDGSGSDCLGKVPKIRTIRIDLSQTEFNSYEYVDYCEGATPVVGSIPKVVKTVNISRDLGFRKPASLTLSSGDPLMTGTTPIASSYLHIIYISPYGRFFAVKSNYKNLQSSSFNYDGRADSFFVTDAALIRGYSFNVSLRIKNVTNPQESNFSLSFGGNIEE